jgi:hypothetical protein
MAPKDMPRRGCRATALAPFPDAHGAMAAISQS